MAMLLDIPAVDSISVVNAETKVFTIGYQGMTHAMFVARLKRYGIKRIIDVRANAISRKAGFSKNSLIRILDEENIKYVHFPQLGIPSQFRKDLRSQEDYDVIFKRYEQEILPYADDFISKVADMIQEDNSALLCFEELPIQCHRYRLAMWLKNKYGFKITNIFK